MGYVADALPSRPIGRKVGRIFRCGDLKCSMHLCEVFRHKELPALFHDPDSD